MSPTVFREGPFGFYFLSREGSRIHVHARTSDGEARFRLESEIELTTSTGMPRRQIESALTLVREHEYEIRSAWKTHFGG